MGATNNRIYNRALHWFLCSAAVIYLGFELAAKWPGLVSAWIPLISLGLPALLAAHLASRRCGAGLPRLSLSFVLAALLLLPPPGGFLVALLAGLAGRGAGVAGPDRRGPAAFAGLAVTLVLAQFAVRLSGDGAEPGTSLGLALTAMLFVLIQALALAFALVLTLDFQSSSWSERKLWRMILLEALTIPLAWLLAATLSRGSWPQAAALSVLVLVGEATLLKLAQTLQALWRSARTLTSRIAELDTLHSVGREILSSLDPHRVFKIVERECRKIFPVEFCFVALAEQEGSGLHLAYSHRRGEAVHGEERTLGPGLATAVAERKRGICIVDLDEYAADDHLCKEVIGEGCRSVMAVPLIIEDKVIGVISVQSERPAAYEEHQLSVLITIAQQAAVAIENARQYQLATVDSLTGFFLRDYFFKRLDEEYGRVARYGGTFSLLMLDLDGFKEINDRHGHLAGDQYLRAISATIRGELRAADLACRYGGDEFCLLLPETELAGAKTIAERIRAAVAQQIVGAEGVALRTTASIGVAVFPQHGGGDVAALLRNADEALYRAKRAGRDCVVPYAA